MSFSRNEAQVVTVQHECVAWHGAIYRLEGTVTGSYITWEPDYTYCPHCDILIPKLVDELLRVLDADMDESLYSQINRLTMHISSMVPKVDLSDNYVVDTAIRLLKESCPVSNYVQLRAKCFRCCTY